MKSERRHELEKNELADWLAEVINKIKPYQNTVLGVLILVVATAGVYTWWTRQAAATTASGWDRFYAACSAQNPDDFDQISRDYPGTHLAHWAAVIAADLHLAMGCELLFSNKANANDELRRAVDHYNTILQETRRPMLRERATYGLARALEAQGDLEGAAARYEEIAEHWPQGPYAATADQRAKEFQEAGTKAWYDRFAKFDPKPAFSDEGGIPGERPAFDIDTLPDDGSLFRPGSFMDLEERGSDEPPPTDVTIPPAGEEEAAPEDAAPAEAPLDEPAPEKPRAEPPASPTAEP